MARAADFLQPSDGGVVVHHRRSYSTAQDTGLHTVFSKADAASAKEAMGRVLTYLEKYPKAHAVAFNGEDEVQVYLAFPQAHWRQVHSTNPWERLNREIRRRTAVVGIFPNGEALLRLVASILVEQNDEWAVSRRSFSLESMAQLTKDASEPMLQREAA